MNDSKNSSKGLLVLRLNQVLTQEQVDQVTETVAPLADKLGLEPIVLCNGADLRIENGRDALLERVCVALEALVAQGQPPELSEPQIAPQALNARPSGLNSRPVVGTHHGEHSPDDIPKEGTYTLGKGEKVGAGLNARPDPFRYESDKHRG